MWPMLRRRGRVPTTMLSAGTSGSRRHMLGAGSKADSGAVRQSGARRGSWRRTGASETRC
ncbi:hypothetical protein Micbo1qcDRAFT_160931 [Microdochium bolleyi]|uniref:Uncharacterized protein n=1 Tax=Microdochium bolleyi TaxID=196109 RepID=A0A136J7J3_9PEZI|nr:hypothetical protein Micbo1qcDRAFT_160931 [Microdochium bolleyi]